MTFRIGETLAGSRRGISRLTAPNSHFAVENRCLVA